MTLWQSIQKSFQNVNVAKFKFFLRIKLPKLQRYLKVNLVIFIFCKLHFGKVFKSLKNKIAKVAKIFKSELSNFHFLQITLWQSIQKSFQNVNVAKFKFILRIKLPKLQTSLKVNLVIFIFCKLHFGKVFKSLSRMLTLLNLNLS